MNSFASPRRSLRYQKRVSFANQCGLTRSLKTRCGPSSGFGVLWGDSDCANRPSAKAQRKITQAATVRLRLLSSLRMIIAGRDFPGGCITDFDTCRNTSERSESIRACQSQHSGPGLFVKADAISIAYV